MFECLTCGARRDTQNRINGHVIYRHLPVDWTEDDLKNTSQEVPDETMLPRDDRQSGWR